MSENKVYEGRVSFDRVSDSGDYDYDFDYHIGTDVAPSLKNMLSDYEGEHIRLSIHIEKLPDPENNEDDEDEEQEDE